MEDGVLCRASDERSEVTSWKQIKHHNQTKFHYLKKGKLQLWNKIKVVPASPSSDSFRKPLATMSTSTGSMASWQLWSPPSEWSAWTSKSSKKQIKSMSGFFVIDWLKVSPYLHHFFCNPLQCLEVHNPWQRVRFHMTESLSAAILELPFARRAILVKPHSERFVYGTSTETSHKIAPCWLPDSPIILYWVA